MRISYALFLLLFTVPLCSQSGIQFDKGTWEEALHKASAEGKFVFVDAYTSWCGPCKWMSKEIFPNEKVGEFFNKKFISLKMDMEKGEGTNFAMKHEVNMYPTFLFFDFNGNLVHKHVGALAAEDLIALGEVASDDSQNQYGLRQRYERTKHPDSALLYDYARVLHETNEGEAARKVAAQYLEKIGKDQWGTPTNAAFLLGIFSADPSEDVYEYVVENRERLYAATSTETVDNFILFSIESPYRTLETTPDFDALQRDYQSVYSKKEAMRFRAEFMAWLYTVSAQPNREFTESVAKHLHKHYKHITDWQMLNGAAWAFYQNTDHKGSLKKATKWALRSVEIDENYYNTDTVAALYAKLKKYEQARQYATLAIRLAKQEDMDATETESLLKEIEQHL